MKEYIHVKGAKEHNLKNIDVKIPKNELVVITGLSGSGKSSLAFDTIYAEGQRRYVESLSSYARQFLGMIEKPDIEYIEGLSPAISIDQKSASHNPRSTVGTVTEIYDYLRLLYARIGHPFCPNCNIEVKSQSIEQIVTSILTLAQEKEEKKVLILSPIIKHRKGEYGDLFKSMLAKGYSRARVDGEIISLDNASKLKLQKYKIHDIEVVIDRLNLSSNIDQAEKSRINDSVETAVNLAEGEVIVNVVDENKDFLYSEKLSCPKCGFSIGQIEPHTFSFNSPHGACPTCDGLGRIQTINTAMTYNPNLTISEGGIFFWSKNMDSSSWQMKILKAVADEHEYSLKTKMKELSKESMDIIMNGTGQQEYIITYQNRQGRFKNYTVKFEGLIKELLDKHANSSDYAKREIEKYITYKTCPDCKGAKLNPVALAVKITNKNIDTVTQMPISKAKEWVDNLRNKDLLTNTEKSISNQILKELFSRIGFLESVGLDYLTLNRTARTLSGGEAQRIRLASQIGSGLSGVLYVLDEPSVGLHQRDNSRLLNTLKELRRLGNSVLVVEHDEETMREANWIIDMGPGAGEHGGNIIAEGKYEDIIKNPNSITGKYLSGEKKIEVKKDKKRKPTKFLKINNASEHNLKNISVKIPLGTFTSITGVSGSGKSTLINDILYPYLSNLIYNTQKSVGKCVSIEGTEFIDKVIQIDQSPIGRTPRSNAVTYIGAFNYIREIFAQTKEAKTRGYNAGRFSFNVKGGRCEQCKGDGLLKIEMQFLPDVYVTCDLCHGKRYNKESLSIIYKGKTIAEVLEMTVEESLEFFKNVPAVFRKVATLDKVGLGYIRLGQSATTLSGGEAQRIKLAEQLSRKSTGKTVYILDEPTTGLHFADIAKLLEVLHVFVDEGNSVIVIEHNMDVIKTSDWIIDLGPEGGDKGGSVVVQGSLKKVIDETKSYTGEYLNKYIRN